MPQENVEIARGIYEQWAQGRMTAGVERFSTDARFGQVVHAGVG